LVRDLTTQEFQAIKDELHLPIKFNELLAIDKDMPIIIDKNTIPKFIFKTPYSSSGVITISQVSWDGLTTLPILVTIETVLINGKRYYYSNTDDVTLECGLWYFEIIDGDHTYYSNLLNIVDFYVPDSCVAILITEIDDTIIETEDGHDIEMEICVESPYVPESVYAIDFDGAIFTDYDAALFTIDI
jgi:hypothetical protein